MRLFDFGSRSIKQKQILILMLTSSMALFLASAGFVVYELLSVRQDMVDRLYLLANSIGRGASAPFEASDPVGAQKVLASTLKDEHNIVRACIYGKDGTKKLAIYPDYDAAAEMPKEASKALE